MQNQLSITTKNISEKRQKRLAESKESLNFAAALMGLQDDVAKNLLSEA